MVVQLAVDVLGFNTVKLDEQMVVFATVSLKSTAPVQPTLIELTVAPSVTVCPTLAGFGDTVSVVEYEKPA